MNQIRQTKNRTNPQAQSQSNSQLESLGMQNSAKSLMRLMGLLFRLLRKSEEPEAPHAPWAPTNPAKHAPKPHTTYVAEEAGMYFGFGHAPAGHLPPFIEASVTSIP